jgi:Xaa-Pro aminopeptidase
VTKERLSAIRRIFKDHNVSGYIVPSNDEYMSEYVPDYARRLEYIAGFTGSNGIAVILEEKALFFTDGRYLDQSKYELDLECFEIFDLKYIQDFPWHKHIGLDSSIGYDPKLFTNPKLQIFQNIKLQPINTNLIDEIWRYQPLRPSSNIYIYPVEFVGQSYSEKIDLCRATLRKHQADGMIISRSDSICWLLNLRASDVPCTPLMLGLAILTQDKLYLFVDPKRLDNSVIKERAEITILPEKQFIETLNSTHGKILVDENSASNFIMDSIKAKNVEKIDDPCQILKACKNHIEIKHAIDGHIQDAVAVCEFFAYIARLTPSELAQLTEYDLGILITEFRSKQKGYIMNSFNPICGFRENSAIIHYFAKKDSAKTISGSGLLLVDSGGQYMGATTDITRTVSIGDPTSKQKKFYTTVLKGHIALATIKFPVNVTGSHLDVLARQFLWQDFKDYPHGTGHGVGSFLGVHEGPQNINLISKIALQPGMIVSNEPGYYLPGEFGIRIENLVYVTKTDNSNFLRFETLTFIPYAKELIDYQMLTSNELDYIKSYYQKLRNIIHPLLSDEAKTWLMSQCSFAL